jgi:hypothetical protein
VILEYLETIPNEKTKKTVLSALFILTGEKKYQEKMMSLIHNVEANYCKQQMNTKQTENWVTFEEVQQKYHTMLPTATKMFTKKAPISDHFLVLFFMFSIMSGVYSSKTV